MDFLSDNIFLDPYFCETNQTQTKNSCVSNDRFALKEESENLFNDPPILYGIPDSDPSSDANSNLMFNDGQLTNKTKSNENESKNKNKNNGTKNNKAANEQEMNSMLPPLDDLRTEFDLDYPDLSLLGDVSNEDEIETQLAKLLGIDENQFKKDLPKNVATKNRENTNPNLTQAHELISQSQKKRETKTKKTKKKF